MLRVSCAAFQNTFQEAIKISVISLTLMSIVSLLKASRRAKVTPSAASTSQSRSCFLAFACALPVPYVWTIPLFWLLNFGAFFKFEVSLHLPNKSFPWPLAPNHLFVFQLLALLLRPHLSFVSYCLVTSSFCCVKSFSFSIDFWVPSGWNHEGKITLFSPLCLEFTMYIARVQEIPVEWMSN